MQSQILFLETLLAEMIVLNRCLWSEEKESLENRIEAMKWSNELAHRLFNLLFELRHEEPEEPMNGMAENINFYRKQSTLFSGYLGASIKAAYERYLRLSAQLFPDDKI